MHKTRTSTNRLPLLVFLAEILFSGCVAGSKQCEVKDIHLTSNEGNSTFIYNFTYKDPSCSDKGGLMVILESCDDHNSADMYTYTAENEGITNFCVDKGRWKMTVSHRRGSTGRVESTCFKCSFGIFMNNVINLSFNYRALKITIQNVNPHLSNWDLTIYKTTDKMDYFTCNEYTMLKTLKRLFQNTRLRPQNITRTQITLSHDFDPEACYCFLLKPISHINLIPENIMFSTRNCTPTPVLPENGGSSIDNLPMSNMESVLLVVLLGIVTLAATVLVVTLGKPRFLGTLLGLRRLIGEQRNSSQKQMLSRNTDVLLLHAPDVSGSEHLAKLKKHLQAAFKVHDLFDRNDLKRLAEPCAWVEEMLMPSSGVKLLLVESEGLIGRINSLIKPYPENPGTVKAAQTSPQAQCADSLLTFALRTIICTNLRGNYSTVFVVRFSDEGKDVGNLVVEMRRYKFPHHFLELKEAMTVARCSSKGKEAV